MEERWFLKSRINRWEAGCRARAQHSPEISPERSRKQFISLLSNFQRIKLLWYVVIIMTPPSTLRWRRAFKTKPSLCQQFWSVFSSLSIYMQVLIYSHIYMDIFITCIFSFSPLELTRLFSPFILGYIIGLYLFKWEDHPHHQLFKSSIWSWSHKTKPFFSEQAVHNAEKEKRGFVWEWQVTINQFSNTIPLDGCCCICCNICTTS